MISTDVRLSDTISYVSPVIFLKFFLKFGTIFHPQAPIFRCQTDLNERLFAAVNNLALEVVDEYHLVLVT